MQKLSVATLKELPEIAVDAIMAVVLMIPAMLSVDAAPAVRHPFRRLRRRAAT